MIGSGQGKKIGYGTSEFWIRCSKRRDRFIIYGTNHHDLGETGVDERERRTGWFWYILLIFYFLLLVSKFEPVNTINEMHSAPLDLVLLVFLIGGAVGFALAFREGKVIRAEMIARRKDRRGNEAN